MKRDTVYPTKEREDECASSTVDNSYKSSVCTLCLSGEEVDDVVEIN